MTPIKVRKGEIAKLEWGLSELSLDLDSFRFAHINVALRNKNKEVHSVSNLDGGVSVDTHNSKVMALIDTSDLNETLYDVVSKVTRRGNTDVGVISHVLIVTKGN